MGTGDNVHKKRPLLKTKRAIRLTRLLDTASDNTISGHLQTFELDSAPAYVALSYTWGSEKATKHEIVINGVGFLIRRNLWQYLARARQTSEPSEFKWLWIDAICINQDIHLEKDHQLPLMRGIYEQLVLVEVWLGESMDGSDEAMRFLESQVQRPPKKKGTRLAPPWRKNMAHALLMLFHRNYWRRIWIIQETLYAPAIDVLCGTFRVPWSCFEALQKTLMLFQSHPRAEHYLQECRLFASPCIELVTNKLNWPKDDGKARTLKSPVYTYRDFACSDPRDRIFALLGLVQPPPMSFPQTYSIDAKEIHTAVLDPKYGSRAAGLQSVTDAPLQSRYHDLFRYSEDIAEALRIVDPLEASREAKRETNLTWMERFGSAQPGAQSLVPSSIATPGRYIRPLSVASPSFDSVGATPTSCAADERCIAPSRIVTGQSGSLPPIMIDESDVVALKRARNTAEARKSRAEKVKERENLEAEIADLKAQVEHWKSLALDSVKAEGDTGA